MSYDKIARATPFAKTDDLLAAIGANDFKLSRALAPFREPSRADDGEPTLRPRRAPRPKPRADFSVSGVGNLLTRMANCCNPIPGDAIAGFITSGRGVSIHRRDCANLRNLAPPRRARLIEAQWGNAPAALPVDIRITAEPRSGLLNDITQLLKDEKVETLKLNLETTADNSADIRVKLELANLKKLNRILRHLSAIPGVIDARRAVG